MECPGDGVSDIVSDCHEGLEGELEEVEGFRGMLISGGFSWSEEDVEGATSATVSVGAVSKFLG